MSVQLVMKMIQPPAGASATQFTVDVDAAATVAELKEQIEDRAGLPKEHIRLVCAGRIWADTATVGSYEPREGAIVHLLNNPPRAQPGAAEQVPREAANPLQQMLGGGLPLATVDSSGDPMQQMMAQSQQMLMQNPEMMQQIMQSPMVQQMMSDPETMRAMMRMNPQLNQLMEQRPEIARLLEDPEVLRQSMQMMANPSLMREMTRNADRAIGRLDALPGGHSALVQAHQEFADPLFQALSGSNSATITENAAAYAQQTEGMPNSEALPNPWGAPAPAPASAPAPAPVRSATPAAAAVQPGANPMASMMQQMLNDPAQMQQRMAMMQQLFGGSRGGADAAIVPAQPASIAAVPAANPMAAMMQQMIGNPAQMQQMMGMAQQLFGGARSATAMGTAPAEAATTPAVTPPVVIPPPVVAPVVPAANPMEAMMQQMLNNPVQMQQMMGMSPLLGGGLGGGFGGGFGGSTFPQANLAGGAVDPLNPLALAAQRARFADQLSQLRAMGFTNEAVCLRVLVQHNGRVDAAIDTLLSMPSST